MVTLQTSVAGETELGSGIVLSPDGLIMTNYHVVAAIDAGRHEPARAVVTFYDGRIAAFSVVAADPKSDVAVIRAQGISGLIPISCGHSAGLHVGQAVMAVGSPLGLQDTVTTGIIRAVRQPRIDFAGAESLSLRLTPSKLTRRSTREAPAAHWST